VGCSGFEEVLVTMVDQQDHVEEANSEQRFL
jgi:hypothetical protein